MSSTYVGNRVQNLDIGEELDKVTRVVLVVDSDHVYTAGNDTGRTIEREIPWGSQAMADALLRKLSGVEYKPFNAERAMISPAFEIGDPVTIGGVYSRIIGADINYGVSGLVDIYAPDLDVTDDEYPAEKTQQSSIERQLAQARSLISKTAEEIRLEVSGLDDKYTALSVTLDGVTVTDGTGTTRIKGSSVETDTLIVKAANVKGTLTAANISANRITGGTFVAENFTLEGLLQLDGYFWDSDYQDWLLDVGGYVGATTGSSNGVGTVGACLTDYTMSNFFIATNAGARMSYSGQHEIYCASVGCRATSEIIVGSDERLKNNIIYDMSNEEKVFPYLKPCKFSYKKDDKQMVHWGFVAQDMLEGVSVAGLPVDSLYVLSKDDAGMYGIAYGEITALNTHMIQRLMSRVEALENRLES